MAFFIFFFYSSDFSKFGCFYFVLLLYNQETVDTFICGFSYPLLGNNLKVDIHIFLPNVQSMDLQVLQIIYMHCITSSQQLVLLRY